MKIKSQTSAQKKSNQNSKKSALNYSRGPKTHIVVPYHQELSEGFKRTCKKYGIEVHLKGGHTIKDVPMAPKDKDPFLKRSGLIYRYKYGRVDCDHKYIGESARNFEDRLKNISRPLPLYITISTSLVILSLLTIFPSWGERTKTSLDSSKRPCT